MGLIECLRAPLLRQTSKLQLRCAVAEQLDQPRANRAKHVPHYIKSGAGKEQVGQPEEGPTQGFDFNVLRKILRDPKKSSTNSDLNDDNDGGVEIKAHQPDCRREVGNYGAGNDRFGQWRTERKWPQLLTGASSQEFSEKLGPGKCVRAEPQS